MLSRLLPAQGPARVLTGITLVHTLGQGLWMALNAIYAITVLHLTPGQFGVGVGIAAGVALAVSTPTGHLADRIGPRSVQVWSFLALGPLTAALLAVDGFAQYVAVVSVQAVAYSASRSARMAMVAGLIPPEQRVTVRAYLRATSNVSVSVGAALAGLLLTVDSVGAYRLAVVLNASTYLATGLLTLLLPAVPAQPARPGPALIVLRDRPYLTFIVLDGLLSMHNLLLDVVLPLWVLHETDAPRWMIAAILLTNTVAVVLLQVRAARGTDEPPAAARASRSGSLCIAAACLVFSLTGAASATVAGALLLLGALAHVLGEIRQSAGSWGLSFGLAPEHAQGQYQGTYAMGADLGKMIAPALLTWLVIEFQGLGWLVMAAGFALVGAAMPAVTAWALRSQKAAADCVTA
ncbi:Major Facilitator Superfamily protein [Streptomyces sp. DI166]|uniref:MFS transporter n=1 Tax=Streptomyces sp. DI166 TaxID=1839783 RepID=UPI0007F430B9|nr:MFS transporter [Streptomyces sp. DI166]SBT94820.1 Major Facilitator Superfamily protein [Streptomyces sp. DI166]